MSTNAFSPSFAPSPFAPLSPFAPHAPHAPVEAEPANLSYALVQSGPPVSPSEVESGHLDVVEITVRWGDQILSVAHLGDKNGFAIGPKDADFIVAEDVVGTETPILVRRGTTTLVEVPANGRAVVTKAGRMTIVEGAQTIALENDMKVTVEVGQHRADGTTGEPIAIDVTTVRAGKKAPIAFWSAFASGAAGFVGLSFLGHAAIVASMAMFMPHMAADDTDALDRDQILLMQKFLNASAERVPEPPKEELASDSAAGGASTGGEPHKGEAGASGTQKSTNAEGRIAFKGHDDQAAISKTDMVTEARYFGIIGLIPTSSMEGPASPWGDTHQGEDAENKMGKMFGSTIDDAMGYGLGFQGVDEGGGGKGAGMGIDGIGSTVGGGRGGPGKWGHGLGDKDGIGNGHGIGNGAHKMMPVSIRTPEGFAANGRLPQEVIQRIVRQNFGRFRLCYENGLRGNPGLTGRVTTKFVIGRDGSVAQSSDAGSDLPNQAVVQCIVRSFQTLSFPLPEGGIATVTYPLMMTPGE